MLSLCRVRQQKIWLNDMQSRRRTEIRINMLQENAEYKPKLELK